VYIWHSSENMIVNNYVAPLGAGTNHWAAISIYDGYNDTQISYGHTSMYNRIVNNTVSDKGIAVGSWEPETLLADNTGTKVHGNKATWLGATYSTGKMVFSGNRVTYGVWTHLADDCIAPGNSNHTPPPGWEKGYGAATDQSASQQESE